MLKSLLIANRGEIACRIIRTARKLGIRTVAVYSDADAKALHVRMADEAIHIGPSPATESYLVGDKIIEAAKATKAQAIHPGYGFLSENADFAQAVIDAGLIWVGPKPDSIRAMGLKDAAKKLMAEAGVPVTPGYLGEDQDPKRLKKEADAIGYPVLIKAVAGGGGKGMRRVDAAKDFQDALESCKREAASSFGDDRVLIEKYILSPRHIEVQVFGDGHGNVVHLFERDCSLQRRHQKVIEEAPAPGMDEATREAVCSAAVRAAKAVNYEGAGTIEFIADASEGLRADRIWFMEMNTRLQVEHPVTEEITGQDLVEWQLRVASGEKLPKKQEELSINGHAIEARLYAEDPQKGFLPSVGRLLEFDLGFRHRIESGVDLGDTISPYYDPMIAKLISRGRNRTDAIESLVEMLSRIQVWPVRTNAHFLVRCLDDEDFESGRINTGLIERKLESLTADIPPDESEKKVGTLNLLMGRVEDKMMYPVFDPDGSPAWMLHSSSQLNPLLGFRLNSEPHRKIPLRANGEQVEIDLTEPVTGHDEIHHSRYGDKWSRLKGGVVHRYEIDDQAVRGSTGHSAADGAILAPMPGKVTNVDVSKGEKVAKGQRLLTLEAMKMEHGLVAPFDGVVAELNATAGAQVQVDALLAVVEAGSSPAQAGVQEPREGLENT
ncbi:MAG: acetyl/propionyl/methylcrotonyl-CoA carboxylase subunit alpha [Pseudomonadota bacterium]|nr:acetyl/propionyl/methylcrotonyl-CoA carboxylase subunit alpha [Pseudomonadota bacterium]